MHLAGKVALVTGASGEIGGAIARRLASADAIVIGTHVEAVGAAEDAMGDAGGVYPMQLDQRSPTDIAAAVDTITLRYGRLDVLVNNAAWNIGVPFSSLDALTPDIWDRILETNLRGPFLLARACAALLKADSGGHIVNISSIGGIAPIGSSIAYASSKAGLNHLTRCLAVALAPHVAVNCVAPGLVENTRMSNRAMDQASQKTAREGTLLQCAAQVEDVVDQVMTFIASSSITGQVIAVDGGVPGAMR